MCHHAIVIPTPVATQPCSPRGPQPPPAPAHILPFCCNRVLLVAPATLSKMERGENCQTATWIGRPHSSQPNTWQPEWVWPRCGSNSTTADQLMQQLPTSPECRQHGPRTLAIELPRAERGWVCSRHNHIWPCQPAHPNRSHAGPTMTPTLGLGMGHQPADRQKTCTGANTCAAPDPNSNRTTGTTEVHRTALLAPPTAGSMPPCS